MKNTKKALPLRFPLNSSVLPFPDPHTERQTEQHDSELRSPPFSHLRKPGWFPNEPGSLVHSSRSGRRCADILTVTLAQLLDWSVAVRIQRSKID